jgi:ABC-type nitrate/sulfonate/bicarbonate transport system substrate-binding protein
MRKARRLAAALAVLLAGAVAAGCAGAGGGDGRTPAEGGKGDAGRLEKVTLVLDWTPNTNHTGLYVARAKGYYAEEGLDVRIILPGEAGAEQMVATGNADFGVSYQEAVTLARSEGVPIVSIAAVIQHNTSGFAAPASIGLKSPHDLEGKKYGGGWNLTIEEAMLDTLMRNAGADPSKVRIVTTGSADFFTSVERGDIDFAWIFYAWTGIEAELRGEPLDILYLNEYAKELDYYTPVLIASEKTIGERPELVRAFMRATAKGYAFAIDHPEEAGGLLADAEPDLDRELVIASQKWLSPRYRDDAPRWGEQKPDVWRDFANWLNRYDILIRDFDPEAAFTNDFLPE